MIEKLYKISVIFIAFSIIIAVTFFAIKPNKVIAQDNEQSVVQAQIKQLNANIMVLSNDLNVIKDEFKKASNPGDLSTKGISGRMNAMYQDIRALNTITNRLQSDVMGCQEELRIISVRGK